MSLYDPHHAQSRKTPLLFHDVVEVKTPPPPPHPIGAQCKDGAKMTEDRGWWRGFYIILLSISFPIRLRFHLQIQLLAIGSPSYISSHEERKPCGSFELDQSLHCFACTT
ncbi:hypothetical protein L2E82_22138 [Cichorium intybus]|uniref:Uncharacterized protein n=1 Tax=Cichorium intybus TaxID=13427 RepID=A0ACB9DXC2_CICIN|nr:hypothetical protein L2E82_22138 [Cichorium intybus]